MQTRIRQIPYSDTGRFQPLVIEYIGGSHDVHPFYAHTPDLNGVAQAVAQRSKYPTDREALVKAIADTHASRPMTEAQTANLSLLSQDRTFTITTAHQPNIFTGYLYFTYKILHAVRLAEECGRLLPEYKFVPVFWMGSEDNDLEELGQFRLFGQRHVWETQQTGPVGRMLVDQSLMALIDRIAEALGPTTNGPELVKALRSSYAEGLTIAEATFRFTNHLFARYGLLILQPDNPALKRYMEDAFRDELLHGRSHAIVSETSSRLEARYKAQAHARGINLFHMEEGVRGRIIREGDTYTVDGTARRFTQEQMLRELSAHPEHFSPNVILRALYQSMVLPDIAFIGGGSEVAYWLQLRGVFDHYKVPFPVIILRNSFIILPPHEAAAVDRSGWDLAELFRPEEEIMADLARRNAAHPIVLQQERDEAASLYARLQEKAANADETLRRHVRALEKKALGRIEGLEQKMLRAEKRKHADARNRLARIQEMLFPKGGLQERQENILPYVARYGHAFLDMLLEASGGLEMRFTILELQH